VPRRDRILPKEVRWRGSKCVSRVLAPLVPDGAAPRTQESHPSTLDGLGAHNERFNWGFPLDATPLGGDHLTSGLGTPTTRAPSVLAVTGWVLAARRAPPNAGARTGSICVRVVLRRGGPCGAPEPLGAPCEPGTCPLCTPSEDGRSTGCAATAHAHEDPAPSTGRARAGAHCTPAHASRCAGGGGGPAPKPNPQARAARARGVGRAGAGGPCGPWLSPAPAVIPRCAQRAHVRHHRVPCGAPGGSRTNTPGTYGTGPTCTPREGGSTVRPVAPTLPCRSQGASTSKKLARVLADLTTPLTKTCGISGLLLVVGSSALLRAHQGRGRLGDGRRPRPRSIHGP
jgi:hypothetical protein